MIEVVTLKAFRKAMKPLQKRYPNILADVKKLVAQLLENPNLGDDLGDGFYKIRMAISDKKTGKSGGARVMTYTTEYNPETDTTTVQLVFIYDKSDISSVSKQDILALLDYE